MKRLEHANLVVKDIQASLEFITTAFPEWQVRGQGQGQWAGKARNWLHIGTDDDYLTLNDGAEGDNRDLAGLSPGLAHLGFEVDDLDALKQRMEDKGYPVDIIGRNHPYRKTAYYIDPNGFQFEFIQYLSQQPELKNQYGGESGLLIKVDKFDYKAFIQELYRQVDEKNIQYLTGVLSSNIQFRIGDHPQINDKAEVLNANQEFFNSITSMSHDLACIWQEGDQIGCHGQVNYVRLDGSQLSVKFSTSLRLEKEKICDYFVFADLSKLAN